MIKNQNYIFPYFLGQKTNNQQPENIIRTIKNKKIVYCHGNNNNINSNNIINNTSKNRIEKKKKNENKEKNINLEESEILNNKTRGQRGSKYRGVSKNGNQWQVLIMINKKKRYIGNGFKFVFFFSIICDFINDKIVLFCIYFLII